MIFKGKLKWDEEIMRFRIINSLLDLFYSVLNLGKMYLDGYLRIKVDFIFV